jgi:hypothetical protein
MTETTQFVFSLTTGIAWLGTLLQLGGLAVCLTYRRLSRWLVLVSAGFAGSFAASALCLLANQVLTGSLDRISLLSLVYLAGSLVGFVSTSLVVGGLAMTFADLRRRLALSLEPTHARR